MKFCCILKTLKSCTVPGAGAASTGAAAGAGAGADAALRKIDANVITIENVFE